MQFNREENNLHREFNGALSGLRQILAIESPLKMMKDALYFTSKNSFRSQDI